VVAVAIAGFTIMMHVMPIAAMPTMAKKIAALRFNTCNVIGLQVFLPMIFLLEQNMALAKVAM